MQLIKFPTDIFKMLVYLRRNRVVEECWERNVLSQEIKVWMILPNAGSDIWWSDCPHLFFSTISLGPVQVHSRTEKKTQKYHVHPLQLPMHSLLPYPHPSLQRFICCKPWAYIPMSLSPMVHTLEWDSFLLSFCRKIWTNSWWHVSSILLSHGMVLLP